MGKVNDQQSSAFAVYSQNSLNTSQESNKSNRKSKRNKNKSKFQSKVDSSANLKIVMKAKDKINLNKQLKSSNLPKKNKNKSLDNSMQSVKEININMNEIKNKSKKRTKNNDNNKPERKIHLKSNSSAENSDNSFVDSPKITKKNSPDPKSSSNKNTKIPHKNSKKNSSDKSSQVSPPDKKSKKTSTADIKESINSQETVGNVNMDSVKTGEEIFQWLLNPVDISKFFRDNWEQQPIIIKRTCSSYYSYLLSSEDIDHALRKQQLFFTKNIDITSYNTTSGLRETHNPPGMATAPLVWDYYSNGCSIRILNPQTFFPKIHSLNASLQEYFGCFVGANVYLTPPGTQGFAPHYDDIEAFVIQLEGSKLWKLYLPRSPAETLPRFSSGNFTEQDLGPPIQEIILEAGDMLYFPRGIIHQGSALENTHSLHITLSMYQKTSWADFLETLLPAALKSAIEEDISFREGIPMHYLSHIGLVHSDKSSRIRSNILSKLQDLMTKIVTFAPVDAAADQLGKKFIHDSLPPFLKKWEKERTVFGDGERISNGVISNQAEMCLGTKIKLIRYNCIRLVNEEESIRIYYSVSNSKEYHAEEPQYLEIDEDLAPAVDALINTYPDFISVEQLPIDDDIAKIQIASDLWEHGIIMTENPLGYSSDDE